MKKPKKIKYIKQLDEKGCVPACIAMITNQSYKEVTKKFFMDFNKEGLTHEKALEYLLNYNLSPVAIMLDRITLESKNEHCKSLIKPFADIHIITSQPWADDDINHCSIMLQDGTILDPGSKKIKVLSDYYEILRIIGFWYET